MSDNGAISVIIANDQESVARMWQRVVNLQPDMECIDCAINGHEAVELATQHQPDVVIMDVMMPGTDGLTATRHILEMFPDTSIIVCSARTDVAKDAYASGAKMVLSLPLMPDVLLSSIRRAVTEKKGNITP